MLRSKGEMAGKNDGKEGNEDGGTLREAFADATDFVRGFVADGKGGRRDEVAKGLGIAANVARKIPSPEEAAAAWDTSPLGRLERKLRARGIVRDRVATADHLRGKKEDDE